MAEEKKEEKRKRGLKGYAVPVAAGAGGSALLTGLPHRLKHKKWPKKHMLQAALAGGAGTAALNYVMDKASSFERGFHEELAKIALDFDPELTSQLMAGGENLEPLQQSPVNVQNAKMLGGALLSMAEQQLKETPGGHRYVSHNPPGTISGFRY